jgi:soluble lytic murein transglycosylase-like protein
MGQTADDRHNGMTPPTGARRRALRAVLSALASGGLTAAALGGPLAGGAMASSLAGVPTTPEVSASSEAATETTSTPANTTTTPAPTTSSTGTSTTSQPSAPVQEAPAVVLQRRQKTSAGAKTNPSLTATNSKQAKEKAKKEKEDNNVANSPQSIAKAGALAAVLASSQASVQALAFYRVPLFLLPIYKAAAVQYGVPWQILAAINEIETDYGTDQSVSSAGAVGWMQFMPSTWIQYGVDALNAGYADPYNPVDAVFAAARYLRAAGAATNLRGAIMAYNHSEEYVDSVLLRAKLISTYPKPVIATLTGLVDGRPPVNGKLLEWGPLAANQSATAGASAVAAKTTGETAPADPSTSAATTPGSTAAPSPTAAAASAGSGSSSKAGATPPLQTVPLTTSANAAVVAVQDGRIMQIGDSRKIGKYVILRDVYGDVFTYAGLGSIARTYTVAKPEGQKGASPVVKAASSKDPAPSQPATAGNQAPTTLQVKTPAPQDHGSTGGKTTIVTGESTPPAGMTHKRLFAHPGNTDARAAAALLAARKARRSQAGQKLPLRKGSVVSSGTVLGKVLVPKGDRDGHLRFAIRPAGDSGYIDPGPVLSNWAQLQKALHPQGARATDALLGATASDVFLLSKDQLERAVLSDPSITIYACGRQDIASGEIDKRVLAVLAFMSRSGLAPTVSALRCGQSQYAASGSPSASYRGDAVEITAINDVPLARHQGPGTLTDLTIRALLTMPAEFIPDEIVSLMHYPSAANTKAESSHWNRISLVFQPAAPVTALKATSSAAHSAGKGQTAPAPVVSTSLLSSIQWTQLVTRVAAIPAPKIAYKPTSSAIPDPKRK